MFTVNRNSLWTNFLTPRPIDALGIGISGKKITVLSGGSALGRGIFTPQPIDALGTGISSKRFTGSPDGNIFGTGILCLRSIDALCRVIIGNPVTISSSKTFGTDMLAT